MTSTNPRYYSSTLAQPALSGRRVTVVGIVIGLILMLVAARGANLQVGGNAKALEIAENQQTNLDVMLAPRGLISDRTGTVLAVSNLAWNVRINPTRVNGTPIVTDTATLASALSGATGRPYLRVKQEMDTIITTWTPTKTNVSTLVAAGLSPSETFRLTTTLTAAKRCCLNFESTWEREYPQGSLAASVLGYVNLVPTGLSGVEDFYDNVLRATPGRIKERGNDVIELQQARPGADLTLTIDANLQRFVERRLAQALKDYDASGGTIIVMETRTGAILSMASLPTYDPNSALGAAASRQGERRLRNQAVSDLYDPGSTMKAVTWAAAIDSGKVTSRTVFNDAGVYRTDGIPIYNSQNGRYGAVSLLEVFQHSINTVTAQVAREYMGAETFYTYMRKFGIGSRTAVDMGGEEQGLMNTPDSPRWSPIVLVTNSYGQGVSMTPIQVIGAINGVANDGAVMQPHVVSKYVLPDGRVQIINPVVRNQAVSPETSRQVRAILGEATRTASPEALIKGYSVAGKTGTAEQRPNGIPVPRPIHTYAGFFPASRPQITILVKLDYPKPAFAKDTTIPVFHDVAERAAQMFNIAPDIVK
ncbi:MAG: penicillin-binding protein 2 [Thermoflexales bacterium]